MKGESAHPTASPDTLFDTPDDLVRRVLLALRVADRALSVLGDDGYADPEHPEDSFSRDKPVAEVAMLLFVCSGISGHPEVESTVRELAGRLASYARSTATAIAIVMNPSVAFQLAMPHILLSQLGLPDSTLDEIVSDAASAAAIDGREKVPHRAMEQLWLRSLWLASQQREDQSGIEMRSMAAMSVLGNTVDILWGSRDDAYAHTHAIMYFTNFGFLETAGPRSDPEVTTETAGLLARALIDEDFDLAAELVMVWPLLRAPESPTSAFGFRVLAELEDRFGHLPAGDGTPERFAQLRGADRTVYAVASSYHTAFVMGMLCALRLRRGIESHPFPRPRSVDANTLAAVTILTNSIPGTSTPWRISFDSLTDEEQASLLPLLVDIALLHAARRNDFELMGRVLGIAFENGCAGSATCIQSVQLLQRMTTLATMHEARRSSASVGTDARRPAE